MFIEKLNEVLASKRSFLSDRINAVGFGISAVLNIIHWGLLYFKISPSQNKILLHYNVVYGPDFVEKSSYLYLIPLLALILLLLNFILASHFYKKEKLSSHFLSIATVAVQMIFFTATVVLIVING